MSAGSAEGDFSPVPRAVITGNAESISAARCASRPRPVAAPRYSQAGRGAIHRRWTRALLLLHQVLGRAARCRLLHRHRRRLRSPDARARVARRRPERAHGRRRHGGDVGGAGVPAAVADDPARYRLARGRLGRLQRAGHGHGHSKACGPRDGRQGGEATRLDESGLGLEVRSRLTHMSPVMWLVPAAFVPGIRALVVDQGVDINAANALGLTALMVRAARAPHPHPHPHPHPAPPLRRGPARPADRVRSAFDSSLWPRRSSSCSASSRLSVPTLTQGWRRTGRLRPCGPRALLEAAAGTTTGLDDHGEALSPSRVLGDVARTDVRAATYLYRLESWLCL